MANGNAQSGSNGGGAIHVWALGVGIVVCGQYFGWNLAYTNCSTPAAMLIASLIVCLMFLAGLLVVAELAVAMPDDGPDEYGRRAGGHALGFGMGWSMMLMCQFGAIATAIASGSYIAFLFDPEYQTDQSDQTVMVVGGLATVALFFLIQLWGLKEQAWTLVVMTLAAIAGLVIFWCVSATNFSWERAWPSPALQTETGWRAPLDAIPYALWWVIIIEGAVFALVHVRNPERSIPRGLVWAMGTVIVMFLLTLGLGTGAMDFRKIEGPFPLAVIVRNVTDNPVILYGFGGIAVFGLVTSYHGLSYSASQQLCLLGRQNYLPRILGRLHASRGTPVLALGISSVISAGCVIANPWYRHTIEVAIQVAGIASLIWYILAMVCVLVLRRRNDTMFSRYRAPLRRVLPVAVILLAVVSLYVYLGLNVQVVPLAVSLYAAGFGYYRLVARRRLADVPRETSLHRQSSRRLRWREVPAAIAIAGVIFAIGWMAIVAVAPDFLRLARVESEIGIVVGIVAAALILLGVTTLFHSQSDGNHEEH